jgi:purine-cytosine permease-like protein
MVSTIPGILFALKVCVYIIIICYFQSQMFEFRDVFEGSVSCFYVMIWSYILVTRHEYKLRFLCLYFRTNLSD